MPSHAGCAVLLTLSIATSASALPRELQASRSKHNLLIVTEEEPGVRSLRFERNGAIESLVRIGRPRDLRLEYTRAAMVALALVEKPKRVLVVGLGGGAMPMFLREVLPEATVDAVDIDPGVIAAARRWFGFREDERLHAFAADGRAFVEASAGGYDLVFLDAYGATDIPRHLATLEFLRLVRDRLSPGGVVIGNLFPPELNPRFGAMHRTWAAAFDQLCALDVPSGPNWIFLARRGASPAIAAQLPGAAALTATLRLPFELKPFVEGGCVPVQATGDVLRD